MEGISGTGSTITVDIPPINVDPLPDDPPPSVGSFGDPIAGFQETNAQINAAINAQSQQIDATIGQVQSQAPSVYVPPPLPSAEPAPIMAPPMPDLVTSPPAQRGRPAASQPASAALPPARSTGQPDIGAHASASPGAFTRLSSHFGPAPGAFQRYLHNSWDGLSRIPGAMVDLANNLVDDPLNTIPSVLNSFPATKVAGGLTGVSAAAFGIAAKSGVWKLNPLQRGQQIEQALGHNLPSNFPVIDRFENGLATSIKSLDLHAAAYQTTSTLRQTLTGYVDKLAGFQGRTWAGVRIRSQDITGRALDLAIPHSGSVAQQAIISQTVSYGASRGVTVNVKTFP